MNTVGRHQGDFIFILLQRTYRLWPGEELLTRFVNGLFHIYIGKIMFDAKVNTPFIFPLGYPPNMAPILRINHVISCWGFVCNLRKDSPQHWWTSIVPAK